jgi:IMP dehydrogenase
MELLAKAKVDAVVIDTAHGDSGGVVEMVKYCARHYPNIDVVAGNVSEPESAKCLAKAGAAGVKVGQGPGSICTTRIIAGVGCPQVTAIYNCAKVLRGSGVSVNGDGGAEHSGDLSIGIGAGADSIMLGRLLAGTTESPGEIIIRPTDGKRVKVYRGMGSLEAMMESAACRERYGQEEVPADQLVPQGVKAEVDFQGDVSKIVFQLLGGLRDGMGYLGVKTIPELQKRADFHRMSSSGLEESHPHGLGTIKEAPNYKG